MAIVLSRVVGSLFNHSESPNINYIKNKKQDCIEYKTTKNIDPGEEPCIFYGYNLWFVDQSANGKQSLPNVDKGEWTGLDISDVYL